MNAGKLYRKEDIDKMASVAVNKGFGEFGSDTYDIFKYKGGPRCKHAFVRKTFVSASKTIDVKSPNAKTITRKKARKFGYNPVNAREVTIKPNDMPNKGFHPNNPNIPKDAR